MTFEIVTSGPRRGFQDRFFSSTVRLIRVLLLIAAVISVPLVGLILIIFVFQTLAATQSASLLANFPDIIRSNLWLVWPLALLAFGGPWLGVLSVKLERQQVLFLRKFGHSDATRAAEAATKLIGQHWTVITLDDGKVAPVRNRPRGVGGSLLLGEVVTDFAPEILLSLGKLLRVAFLLTLGSVLTFAAFSVISNDQSVQGGLPKALFALVLCGALIVTGIFTVVIGLPLWFAIVIMVDHSESSDDSLRHSASSVEALLKVREQITNTTRSFFGAKLIVVTVDTSSDPDLWRKAIGGFAVNTVVALIDVSQPTEHIHWEIVTLLEQFGDRCVYIGDAARLTALRDEATTEAGQLLELLAGKQVLAYRQGRHNLRRFARALRATLESRARLPEPTEAHDPLTDPIERKATRATALVAAADVRHRLNLSIPDAIEYAREAEQLYCELAVTDQNIFDEKHSEALQLLRTLEARPDALLRRRWFQRGAKAPERTEHESDQLGSTER